MPAQAPFHFAYLFSLLQPPDHFAGITAHCASLCFSDGFSFSVLGHTTCLTVELVRAARHCKHATRPDLGLLWASLTATLAPRVCVCVCVRRGCKLVDVMHQRRKELLCPPVSHCLCVCLAEQTRQDVGLSLSLFHSPLLLPFQAKE